MTPARPAIGDEPSDVLANESLKVISICGFGRSGSTLLGLLLARSADAVCIGESTGTWSGIRDHFLCTCGLRSSECEFWTGFVKAAFGSDDVRSVQAWIEAERKVLRWRRVPQLLTGVAKHWPMGREVFDAGNGLRQLYRWAAEQTGAHTIIDTSSDPVHAMLLAQLAGVSFKAIHLVRDPRGAAYSWSCRASTNEERAANEGAMMLEKVSLTTAAWKWLRANLLTQLLTKASGGSVFVRYEDLVADAEAVLERICQGVGLDGHPGLDPDGTFRVPNMHILAGNTRVLFGGSSVKLSSNTAWQRDMSPADERRVTLRTLPLLTRYGYPLSFGYSER